jgi:hypothetical protein
MTLTVHLRQVTMVRRTANKRSVPGKTQKNGIPVCEFKKITLNIAG